MGNIFSDDADILLVSMPWGYVLEPTLGSALLKAELREAGIACNVLEASMRMLRYLKYQTYATVGGVWPLNDFTFTAGFEQNVSPTQMDVLHRTLRDDLDLSSEKFRTRLPTEAQTDIYLRLRNEIVPRFLDDLMTDVDFSRYAMVGFTCLFDQVWPSLAMAHRIKQSFPHVMIAFGGYQLQNPAGKELQSAFKEVDVVAYGDGEPVIVPLAEAALGIGKMEVVPNISWRNSSGMIIDNPKGVKADLENAFPPDYDAFFQQRELLNEQHKVRIPIGEMPMESSRGCWWGQKAHCIFCGIDSETMKYRSKSGAKIEAELDAIHDRYGTQTYRFADYIMPLANYKEFLPRMEKRGAPYNLHYEIKANMNAGQIQQLAKAGVFYLQPGIESFSTPTLKRMEKGVTALQNVFSISTMMRHGIFSYYNLIFGFPSDTLADYTGMLELVPKMYHLIPPGAVIWPMVTRYAPMAENPERFGKTKSDIKAHWRYQSLFSPEFIARTGLNLDNMCYYFTDIYREFPEDMRGLFECLQFQVQRWRVQFLEHRAHLEYQITSDEFVVDDTRLSVVAQIMRYPAEYGLVYEAILDQKKGRARILDQLQPTGIGKELMDRALAELVRDNVIIMESEEFVGLAFRKGSFDHRPQWWFDNNGASKLQNRNSKTQAGWGPWPSRSPSSQPKVRPPQPLPILA